MVSGGLPVARTTTGAAAGRPRIAFGAALPVEIEASAELLDLFLTTRLPRWRVRESLEPRLPEGWTLVDLEDVWLGGPPLPGLVAAADYRIELGAPPTLDTPTIERACHALLSASSLPREREKGGGMVTYDLRPLLIDVAVVTESSPPLAIRARTRFHPTLGTGRPEEVVAALADQIGHPLVAATIVRERVLLTDDLEA